MGCRWAALHRLCRFMGSRDSGPCARRNRASRPGSREGRLVIRCADRSRDRNGGDLVPAHAVTGNGAAGVFRNRGDDDRASSRARVHRTAENRQIRRLLSRSRRQSAGEGRFGCTYLRSTVVGRRAAVDCRRNMGPVVQRSGPGGRRVQRASGRDRRHHRRTGRRQYESDCPKVGLPARLA